MIIKSTIYFLILLLIFLFPQRIKAGEPGTVHFYKTSESGYLEWDSLEIEQADDLSETDRAIMIFNKLFSDEKIPFIPDGVKVLGISIFDGCLNINVSKEILNYGGTYNEIHLKNQIIKTALNIPDISKVSLIIENLRDYLPEGSVIKEETGWNESADTRMIEAGEQREND